MSLSLITQVICTIALCGHHKIDRTNRHEKGWPKKTWRLWKTTLRHINWTGRWHGS